MGMLNHSGLLTQGSLVSWLHADPTICVAQQNPRSITTNDFFFFPCSLQSVQFCWSCVHLNRSRTWRGLLSILCSPQQRIDVVIWVTVTFLSAIWHLAPTIMPSLAGWIKAHISRNTTVPNKLLHMFLIYRMLRRRMNRWATSWKHVLNRCSLRKSLDASQVYWSIRINFLSISC